MCIRSLEHPSGNTEGSCAPPGNSDITVSRWSVFRPLSPATAQGTSGDRGAVRWGPSLHTHVPFWPPAQVLHFVICSAGRHPGRKSDQTKELGLAQVLRASLLLLSGSWHYHPHTQDQDHWGRVGQATASMSANHVQIQELPLSP